VSEALLLLLLLQQMRDAGSLENLPVLGPFT
jgi:hypothetical protein